MGWPEVAPFHRGRQRTCPICGAPPRTLCLLLSGASRDMALRLGLRPSTRHIHRARFE